MIKKFILYFFYLFPVFILAQNQVLEEQVLEPGTTTSVSFKIKNTSFYEKKYQLDPATKSDQIVPISTSRTFTLRPEESYILVVPIKILTATPQGIYSLELHISELGSDVKYIQTIPIKIEGHRKLILTKGETPDYVKAGEKIESTVVLKNNGNTMEELFLSSNSHTVIDGDSLITLLPGESKIITLTYQTSDQQGSLYYQNISIEATTKTKPFEKLSIYNTVKLIPIHPIREDVYHRLPINISMIYLGQRNAGSFKDGYQLDISGIGSLRKNSSDLFQFQAISKNPVEFNAFTPYEQYFASYKNKTIFAHIGDKAYTSSLLTEFARYGRGAELNYTIKNFKIGAFYNHPRFFREIKEEYHLYTSYQIAKNSEIKSGYLIKQNNSNLNSVVSHLPYIYGKTTILNKIETQAEIAYSHNILNQGFAYMSQLQGNFDRFNGGLLFLKASPHFAGYFTNTNSFTANVHYRLFKRLSLTSNYRQDATNFKRDTLMGIAPYQKYFQSGFEFQYAKKGRLALSSGFQKYQDRMYLKRFDYSEKFLRANLNHQIGIFTLVAETQIGKTENFITNATGLSRFYSFNVAFEKYNTSINLYGSYAQNSRYLDQVNRQFYYGARVMSRFSKNNSLSIFYQNNYAPEEYYTDRNLFEILYRQQLGKNHFFDLSGRYTLQRVQLGNKDFIFSLKYTLQINAPIHKTVDYVTLSGNIVNLGVKKIEGIRIFLGNYIAITDKNGNFTFKNIVPQQYILDIDRSTLELSDITDIAIPTQINVLEKENFFTFGITRAATVEGKITLTSEKENNATSFAHYSTFKDKKKSETIIIEASQNNEVFRKIVKIGEDFKFMYLRPGNWKIKIYRENLDKRYKIDKEDFDIYVNPGESLFLPVQISKKEKEIRYQQDTIKVSYYNIKKQ